MGLEEIRVLVAMQLKNRPKILQLSVAARGILSDSVCSNSPFGLFGLIDEA